MSSATILFVLAEHAQALAENGRDVTGVAMAFGPGLTVEMAQLSYVPDCAAALDMAAIHDDASCQPVLWCEQQAASSADDRYDVAVIGAGPAGGSAASALATAGWRVALIERTDVATSQGLRRVSVARGPGDPARAGLVRDVGHAWRPGR